jgi:hypothetical protein
MDRKIRELLEEQFNIGRKSSRLGVGIVEKWIGFSYSEVMRIKPPSRKYIQFRYPLIEAKMSNEDVLDYYEKNQLPIPPRSVCNACFANGLERYKDMREHRPEDWQQALAVDDLVRDLSCIKIHDKVFVSAALRSLRELSSVDFELGGEDNDKYSCDSGYCFT